MGRLLIPKGFGIKFYKSTQIWTENLEVEAPYFTLKLYSFRTLTPNTTISAFLYGANALKLPSPSLDSFFLPF